MGMIPTKNNRFHAVNIAESGCLYVYLDHKRI